MDRQKITAKVINRLVDRNNIERLVLGDVYVNGSYFRDHCYIRVTKRTKHLKIGGSIEAYAEVYKYIDVATNRPDKQGVRSLRSAKLVSDT